MRHAAERSVEFPILQVACIEGLLDEPYEASIMDLLTQAVR